jgi:hypothetical protein
MAHIYPQKMTAELDGEFVVFLIGMRINKPWKIHKWLPVFLAMPRMLKELAAHPEAGFLGHIMSPGVIVQYWRSLAPRSLRPQPRPCALAGMGRLQQTGAGHQWRRRDLA